jgi:hypothetical protein
MEKMRIFVNNNKRVQTILLDVDVADVLTKNAFVIILMTALVVMMNQIFCVKM